MIYKVSGTSFHQEAITELGVGDAVHLVPDPENKYDVNAIQVQSESGKLLGWIPGYAHLNEQMKNEHTDDEIQALEATVEAIIGQKFDKFGLRIKVKTD